MATTNYNLPEFSADESVNLIGVYNAAMQAIDTKLKELSDKTTANETAISSLQTGLFTPDTATDQIFSVQKLGNAKVTSNGIVYFQN